MELQTVSTLAQLTNQSNLATDDRPEMPARSSGMKLKKKHLYSPHLNETQRRIEAGEEVKRSVL